MSKKSVIKMTALAAAFAATAVPMAASAEISGSLGASSFYLWRGQDLSAGGGVISGSVDFTAAGFYTGVWGSSEASGNGGEYDLYAGFGGEAGGLSYDISYWTYVYPGAGNDIGAGEIGEIIGSIGVAGLGVTYYTSVYNNDADGDRSIGDDDYLTVSYSYDKFSILAGTWMKDADDEDYTHVDISYSPVENLTFTVSKVVESDDLAGVTDEQDTLFHVGYSFPL